MSPATAYIALGSNLDDPAAQVRAGFAALAALPGTRRVAQSSLYRSTPVGYRDQPDFINAVACVTTTLAPRALLDALLAIEREHGRVRGVRNGPRTLDLDLLLYENLQHHEVGLTLPHPRLHERAFVLAPLAEIDPALKVPGQGAVQALLQGVDSSGIERLATEVASQA